MSEEGANIIVKNLKGNDLIIVRKEISNLLSQLEEQKKLNEEHQKINGELREEVKKLEDNWNKLRKYIRESKIKEFEKEYGKRFGKTFTQAEIIICNMIIEKMQELESGDSNE